MIIYGTKWKCEGPVQVKHWKKPKSGQAQKQYMHHLIIHNIWQPSNCPVLYMPDKRNFTVCYVLQDKIYK